MKLYFTLLNTIGERKSATAAQVALAWLLAQKPWIVPIPGTTKHKRLAENIKAAEVRLSNEELKEIETSATNIAILGDRYSEANMKMTGR